MFDCDEFIESLTMLPEDPIAKAARDEHSKACEDCRRIEEGVLSKVPVKPNPRVRENVLAFAQQLAAEREKAETAAQGPARARADWWVLLGVLALLTLVLGFVLGRAFPAAPAETPLSPERDFRISGPRK